MRQRDRLISPAGHAQGLREQRLGSIPERDLADEQRKQGRFEWQTPMILTTTLGPWFRENVPVGGTQTMRLLSLVTHSTTAATLGSGSAGGASSFRANNAVRIIGGGLHTPQTITAGSATLGVRLDSADVRLISDAVLSPTYTAGQWAMLGWRRGYQVAAGQTVTPVIVTSVDLAPTNADISAWLVLAWEEPT